jgi:hypothetical protein
MARRYVSVLAIVLAASFAAVVPRAAKAVLVEAEVSGPQEQIAGTTLTLVDQQGNAVPARKREDKAGAWLWDVPAGSYTIRAIDPRGRAAEHRLEVPSAGKVSILVDAATGAFVVSGAGAAAPAAAARTGFEWSIGPSVFVFRENRRLTTGFRLIGPPNLTYIDFSATNDHVVAAPMLDIEGRWPLPIASDIPTWLLAGLMVGGGFSGDFTTEGPSSVCFLGICNSVNTALHDERSGVIRAPYDGLAVRVTDGLRIFGEAGLWAEHHRTTAKVGNAPPLSQSHDDFRAFLGLGGQQAFTICQAGDASIGLGAYYLFEGGRVRTTRSQVTELFFVQSQSRGTVAGMAKFDFRF